MRRKDADALARMIEGDPADGRVGEDLRALGALAETLERSTPAGAQARPRDEFKTELRALLVDEARVRSAPAPGLLTQMRQRVESGVERWRYSSRLAAATGATALALSGGGVAAAAQQALPQDVLYPVKLALADARAVLVRDDVERGHRYLGYAVDRVRDARLAVETASQPGAARALSEADESARKGAELLLRTYQDRADASVITALDEFARDQRRRIAGLLPLLADEAAEAARDSLVVLGRIDARIAAIGVCPACPSGTSTSPVTPAGAVFDFSRIPAADEPFTACPCDPASPPAGAAAQEPVADDEPRPSATEPDPGAPPEPSDDPPPSDEPVVPEELGDTGEVVNEVLKDVIDKTVEKAPPVSDAVEDPGAVPQSGLLDDADGAPDSPLDPEADPGTGVTETLLDSLPGLHP